MESDFHDFRSRTVVDVDGRAIGRVHDLRFDTTRWVVTSLVVRLEREVAQSLGIALLLHPTDLAIRVEHILRADEPVRLRVGIHGLLRQIESDDRQGASLH
jgi:sporulation protein YlmC with PRC-barrel domain